MSTMQFLHNEVLKDERSTLFVEGNELHLNRDLVDCSLSTVIGQASSFYSST